MVKSIARTIPMVARLVPASSARTVKAAPDPQTPIAGRIRSALLLRAHKWLIDRHYAKYETADTGQRIMLLPDTVKGGDGVHAHEYSATPRKVLDWLLQSIFKSVDDARGFSFIDIGSGRGRVLTVAAAWPFSKVIGVEFSQELHQDAERNIARWPEHMIRAGEVSSHHEDATKFTLPAGNAVVFFFNPFDEPTMVRALAKITKDMTAKNMAAHDGKLYLIFLNPKFNPGIIPPQHFERFQPGWKQRSLLALASPFGAWIYRSK